MLSAAYDAIKAQAPGRARSLLGGLCSARTSPAWLERVFATPGRGRRSTSSTSRTSTCAVRWMPVVRPLWRVQGVARRARLQRAALGDRARLRGRPRPSRATPPTPTATPSQAAYLTADARRPGRGGRAAGVRDAPRQPRRRVRDRGARAHRANRTRSARASASPRCSRLVENWDQVMAWRDEQRDEGAASSALEQAAAAISANEARERAREVPRRARCASTPPQDDVARAPLRSRKAEDAPRSRRLARARAHARGPPHACCSGTARSRAGTRTAPYERAAAVELLKQRIAGG